MTQQILPFCATDTGTNLLTQTEYASDTQRSTGHQPGIARSKLENKALRQSSFVASSLAEFVNQQTSIDVLDDANVTTLRNNIAKAAIYAASNTYTDSGTANAYVLAAKTPVNFSPITALYNGMIVRFIAANPNTTSSTINVLGTGVLPLTQEGGSALTSGYITATNITEARYVASGPRWEVTRATGTISTISYATASESDAGTINNKAITPASLGTATKSLTSNGYTRIPGGMILQWGSISTTNESTASVTFPITFPNACLQAFTTFRLTAVTSGGNTTSHAGNLSTTGMTVVNDSNGAGAGTTTIMWTAIGY